MLQCSSNMSGTQQNDIPPVTSCYSQWVASPLSLFLQPEHESLLKDRPMLYKCSAITMASTGCAILSDSDALQVFNFAHWPYFEIIAEIVLEATIISLL